MRNQIATLILRWLDSSEMKRESLYATLQFGMQLEHACQGTLLNGQTIRDKWIPFRYGLSPGDDHNLRVLALLLMGDPSFVLVNMHIEGCTGYEISQRSKTIPGWVFDERLQEALFGADCGI